MARKLSTSIFKTQKIPNSNTLGQVGYDNARENIDPHVKTKVVSTQEGSIERTPTADNHIANKKYVDDEVAGVTGLWEVDGTETQLKTADAIDMQTKKIINVVDPTANQEAATKKYVDDNAGGAVEGTAVLSTGEGGGTKFLREDGDNTCSWQAAPASGDVTAGANMTNNSIVRGDGGVKGVQDSGVLIDDDDDVSGMKTLSFDDGNDNIFMGTGLIPGVVSTASYNVGIGERVLYDLTTGIGNTAISKRALYNVNTGNYNNAMGYQSMYNFKEGDHNSALGANVLYNLLAGSYNLGMASTNMYNMKYGNYNSAIGVNGAAVGASWKAITSFEDYSGTVAGTVKANSAAHGLTTGDKVIILNTTNYNAAETITVIDVDSFRFTAAWVADQTGTWYNYNEAFGNLFLGHSAGDDLTTGSKNIFIGYTAGRDISPTASNQLWIDNSTGTSPFVFGDMSAMTFALGGFITPSATLHVKGTTKLGEVTTNYMSSASNGTLRPYGTATYQANGGNPGITQSETGVNNFDIAIEDGLITSFTKNS